ncbi:MAG: hypothetical protein ACKO8Q_06990 [Bacteroidota bacterium]
MSNLRDALSHFISFKKGNLLDFPEWIWHSYSTDLTYRLPAQSGQDKWLGFREIYRLFKRPVSNLKGENYSHLILVSTPNQIQTATAYISLNLKECRNPLVLSRENLRGYYDLSFFFFSMRMAMHCIFSKNRIHWALAIREIMEWSVVIGELKKNNISTFIDFTPFERDSNILAALLMKVGISVIKIPSPGPLQAHHSRMLADVVICSSAYQLEEIQKFSEWKIKQVLHWPPEQFHTYDFIYESKPQPPSNTIAFYSHGEWVRRQEGHADIGLGILENEEYILCALNKFIDQHPDFKLTIYPHPKERNHNEFQEYYNQKLSNIPFAISSDNNPTSFSFHKQDIAIMAYSTLLFERLCLGYKSFFVSTQSGIFPINSSPLNNICLRNTEEIVEKILHSNTINDSEFFKKHGLTNYLLSNFINSKK